MLLQHMCVFIIVILKYDKLDSCKVDLSVFFWEIHD